MTHHATSWINEFIPKNATLAWILASDFHLLMLRPVQIVRFRVAKNLLRFISFKVELMAKSINIINKVKKPNSLINIVIVAYLPYADTIKAFQNL